MRRFIITALALTAVASAAWPQVPPYVHGATVGTSVIQAAPNNTLRRKIILYTPNQSAVIAFCPSGPNRDTGQPLVCSVYGPGSITLQPSTGMILQGSTETDRLSMPSAWNVIANTGGSTYTFIDFE